MYSDLALHIAVLLWLAPATVEQQSKWGSRETVITGEERGPNVSNAAAAQEPLCWTCKTYKVNSGNSFCQLSRRKRNSSQVASGPAPERAAADAAR